MTETAQQAPTTAPLQPESEKFGTFLGVYTPSVLTILGLIMYLRFGWVVGNVGLPLTLLIVLLASSVTFVTALSASAIATNMRVGVGGEYYMVAHSLGLEFGGAIGIPLYLCRTLSITFYSYGLAESIVTLLRPDWGLTPERTTQVIAAVTVIGITAVSGKSAGLALRLQIPIMIAVALSLLALTGGVITGGTKTPELAATYRTAPEGFWFVFAVFFPAVTGFTAGIGLSGDLKDPRKSIPGGTLGAVVTGAGVYLVVPLLLATTALISAEELAQPGLGAWTSVAILGAWIVYPGMWGAILSSGFGSALGGPRVLQALAKDGLAPSPLARVSKTGQPVLATWVSALIALAAVASGGLNAVARLVTILFLTLYVAINLSAAAEKWGADPSFRPTIKVPWLVSLAGSLGAVVVMFLISPLACAIAITLELALYIYLRQKVMQRRWGDAWAGVWMTLARISLLRLREHLDHPRNWRPNILVFVGAPEKRIGLVRMAGWLSQGRGIVTATQLIEGDLLEEDIEVRGLRREMDSALAADGLLAFGEIGVVPDFESGVIGAAQANGIAGLESNTVLVGWPKKPGRLVSWLRITRALGKLHKSTLITRLRWDWEPGQQQKIVVWWGGLEHNGDLMLLLAHLLQLNPEWTDSEIVIRSIARSDEEMEFQQKGIDAILDEVRIEATAHIIRQPPSSSIAETIHEHSSDASIVFMGMHDPDPGTEEQYAERLEELADGLCTTIFVRNASEFAGRLV